MFEKCTNFIRNFAFILKIALAFTWIFPTHNPQLSFITGIPKEPNFDGLARVVTGG
jgi:hypothetical protein